GEKASSGLRDRRRRGDWRSHLGTKTANHKRRRSAACEISVWPVRAAGSAVDDKSVDRMNLDPLIYRRGAMCRGNPILLVLAPLQVLDWHVIVLVTDVQRVSLIFDRGSADRDDQQSPTSVVVIQ